MMWSLSSRVHKLNAFPSQGVQCYVKRDDELSCGISGTKLRKYASIIPFLKEKQIKRLIIIAGTQSNNLLAALQIAREHQLDVTAFLLKPKGHEIQGNFKLSLLFLNDDEIIWVERSDWEHVDDLANDYLNQQNHSGFVLSEGASVPHAMIGAMTLAQDVCANENELGLAFQHVFIDAGTGFSAAGLINGLSKIGHQALVHVLLLADRQSIFEAKLTQWLGFTPLNYRCFYPKTARSFGAVNQTIKNEVKRLAREEGILADPIYSAKLFYEARHYIAEQNLSGACLIIHSGGVLTMPGFNY